MMQTTPQVSTARNQASLVVSGQDALALRLALIREARYSIMAQYYSWAEDVSGKLLLGALIAAARRGVKVRILVDDLYSGSNRYLESLAAEPNIQVRVFNPFWLRWGRPWGWALEILLSFRRLNHRMHNKLLVVDGDWAMVGGRNIGDGYLGLSADHQFVDLDLLLRGRLCGELAGAFLCYWRSQWSHPGQRLSWFGLPTEIARQHNEFLLALSEPDTALHFGVASTQFSACLRERTWHAIQATLVLDPPGKGLQRRPASVSRALLDEMSQICEQLTIVSPYLVPTRALYQAFHRVRRRRARVRLLTNSLAATDMPLAYAGFRSCRSRLLKAGAEVHELKPCARQRYCLHAKLALFDHQRLLIGSLNLDPRSFNLNTEIALLLQCPELVAELETWLSHLLQPARSWDLRWQKQALHWPEGRVEPDTGYWQRLCSRILGWFPLHSLL